MVTHILIESVSAVDAAREAGIDGKVVWHSSSPGVIETLAQRGEEVAWLEDNVEADLTDRLGPITLQIVEDILQQIDPAISKLDIPSLSPMLGRHLHLVVGTLLYKQALLSGWMRKFNGSTLVGVPKVEAAGDGNVGYHRYDTLFAILAAHPENGLNVIDHHADRPDRDDVVDKPSALGRFLSFSDISFNQLLWRAWRYGLGGRRLGLGPTKTRILLMRGNDFIREILPHILSRGASIELLRLSNQRVTLGEPLAGLPGKGSIRTCFPSGGELNIPSQAVADCVSLLLREASRWWHPLSEQAQAQAEELVIGDRPTVVLTNTPPGFYANALIAALDIRGVKTVISEHGVSAGLSAYHLAIRRWSEARFGSAYLVCSMNTRRFLEADDQVRKIAIRCVGLADIIRNIRLRHIQRFLVRKSLAVRKERVVLYLARPEQNNLRNIPYSSHDRDTYVMQKAIATEVLPQVRGCGVLKTYPTQRFIDPMPFGRALAFPKNVKIIDKGDFRFVRAASDVIILASLMSTVGYAFGADVPIVFLRQKGIDPLPDVEATLNEAVFVIDTREPDWVERLLALLNRPDKELEAAWEEKRAAREAFMECYITGPQNAGRNAAIELLALSAPAAERRVSHPA